MIRAALFDLDGVIRHFDVAPLAEIERRHGLAQRAVLGALLRPSRLELATTGRMSDEEWRRAAAEELGEGAGADLLAWDGLTGLVDREVVDLVARVRERVPVGLLTNATSRLSVDLQRLGLHGAFDAVVNTSEVGFAKPDARAFGRAADALGLPFSAILFVDDTLRNVEAAAALGFAAHRFVGAEALRTVLAGYGLV